MTSMQPKQAAPRKSPRAPKPKAQAQASGREAAANLPDPPAPTLAPDQEDRVRQEAYFLYERNGCVEGQDMANWLAAEARVQAMSLDGTAPFAAEGERPTP